MRQDDLDALLAADDALARRAACAARRRFAAELGGRGVFVRLGRAEAYLCLEDKVAWALRREVGCLDAQAGRLHLIVGRVPGR